MSFNQTSNAADQDAVSEIITHDVLATDNLNLVASMPSSSRLRGRESKGSTSTTRRSSPELSEISQSPPRSTSPTTAAIHSINSTNSLLGLSTEVHTAKLVSTLTAMSNALQSHAKKHNAVAGQVVILDRASKERVGEFSRELSLIREKVDEREESWRKVLMPTPLRGKKGNMSNSSILQPLDERFVHKSDFFTKMAADDVEKAIESLQRDALNLAHRVSDSEQKMIAVYEELTTEGMHPGNDYVDQDTHETPMCSSRPIAKRFVEMEKEIKKSVLVSLFGEDYTKRIGNTRTEEASVAFRDFLEYCLPNAPTNGSLRPSASVASDIGHTLSKHIRSSVVEPSIEPIRKDLDNLQQSFADLLSAHQADKARRDREEKEAEDAKSAKSADKNTTLAHWLLGLSEGIPDEAAPRDRAASQNCGDPKQGAIDRDPALDGAPFGKAFSFLVRGQLMSVIEAMRVASAGSERLVGAAQASRDYSHERSVPNKSMRGAGTMSPSLDVRTPMDVEEMKELDRNREVADLFLGVLRSAAESAVSESVATLKRDIVREITGQINGGNIILASSSSRCESRATSPSGHNAATVHDSHHSYFGKGAPSNAVSQLPTQSPSKRLSPSSATAKATVVPAEFLALEKKNAELEAQVKSLATRVDALENGNQCQPRDSVADVRSGDEAIERAEDTHGGDGLGGVANSQIPVTSFPLRSIGTEQKLQPVPSRSGSLPSLLPSGSSPRPPSAKRKDQQSLSSQSDEKVHPQGEMNFHTPLYAEVERVWQAIRDGHSAQTNSNNDFARRMSVLENAFGPKFQSSAGLGFQRQSIRSNSQSIPSPSKSHGVTNNLQRARVSVSNTNSFGPPTTLDRNEDAIDVENSPGSGFATRIDLQRFGERLREDILNTSGERFVEKSELRTLFLAFNSKLSFLGASVKDLQLYSKGGMLMHSAKDRAKDYSKGVQPAIEGKDAAADGQTACEADTIASGLGAGEGLSPQSIFKSDSRIGGDVLDNLKVELFDYIDRVVSGAHALQEKNAVQATEDPLFGVGGSPRLPLAQQGVGGRKDGRPSVVGNSSHNSSALNAGQLMATADSHDLRRVEKQHGPQTAISPRRSQLSMVTSGGEMRAPRGGSVSAVALPLGALLPRKPLPATAVDDLDAAGFSGEYHASEPANEYASPPHSVSTSLFPHAVAITERLLADSNEERLRLRASRVNSASRGVFTASISANTYASRSLRSPHPPQQ